MKPNPATQPLHLDHIGDNNRAVVVTNRIGNIVQIVSWTVHGDKTTAMHDINTLKTCEVEHLLDAAEWIATSARLVLEGRRALPEDVGGIVVGAGARRAI